jgi:hypothetical protein
MYQVIIIVPTIIIIKITIISELQPSSSLDRPNYASPRYSVRSLGFPVVYSTYFKVFFNTIHPSILEGVVLTCLNHLD